MSATPVTGVPASATGSHPHPLLRSLAVLLAVAAVLVGIGILVGKALASAPGGATSIDHRVSVWFVEHRSGGWNTVTALGSRAGDTFAVVAIGAIAVIVLLVVHRRHQAMFLVVAMVGEVAIFLTLTALVDRPRPDVVRLDAAPPTSSFPSGHTFAVTTLWATLLLLALSGRWPAWMRRVLSVLVIVIPLWVATSRLYRGMHHLTDVLSSFVLAALWLTAVALVLRATDEHNDARHAEHRGDNQGDNQREVEAVNAVSRRAPQAR